MKNDFLPWRFTITKPRMMLLFLAAVSTAIIVFRLITGFGLVTNLNDNHPWGFWIAFDVLAGVALAGGGYSTALIVHILHQEQYISVARSALLTSLFGYILVMAGLFLDIGQWFNFWRPFVSWGHSSVLFEVFWCLSIYTTIQILEFGEIVTERVGVKFHAWMKKLMPILLIVGVIFPTLHQSSLGGLFLIAVYKLYPLWWSSFIPIFFLLSSFFVGPAMICVESIIAGRAFNHDISTSVLHGLAKISSCAMILYFVLKIYDLSERGILRLMFTGNIEGNIFLIEMIAGIILPVGIVFSKWGITKKGLLSYGLLVSGGVILNRLSIVFIGLSKPGQGSYLPTVWEVLTSLGLVAIGCLAYCFIVENFRIFADKDNKKIYLKNSA
ncbi:NrfD/PsrC family molybdoenzyme membrane anchor subunit [Pelosinus propionicus]|uniref:Ni/Fe-hydrogenase 2 integral membrane subunit HybB n=1 Tax=Pelosinus propionicus DSM 13327 TaxID=1123291 RepID=A0A1I4HVD2_9FIRM|nr:Ni/Fe-hydrogenase cytochrome b subunit [Pelosinus propionicus]SFL45737.1 Ni/Fe-hydrogenase 2 integral membrane subunit HybB [Pelosinus propionicus DSM 13327]